MTLKNDKMTREDMVDSLIERYATPENPFLKPFFNIEFEKRKFKFNTKVK